MTFRAEPTRPIADSAGTPMPATSYGLGQGAASVAWTELRSGPMIGCPTRRLLASLASRSQSRPAGASAATSAASEGA